MVTLNITRDELAAGRMSAAHVERAVRALRTDGVVVLADVIDPDHVRVLRDKMLADVERFLARPDAPFNWNTGNVQQDPPPHPPYLFRDVMVNDIAIAAVKPILGPGMRSAFYSGNTATAGGAQRQPVHADVGQLWPDLEHPTPPYAYVVNVPTVDMGPDNGSTELWPGTHLDTTVSMQAGDIKVPADKLDARRRVAPPVQPLVRAGSVVIRDVRLWHAGMPNPSRQHRPMIALIYSVSWWPVEPLRFPKGTEPIFQHPDLTTVARFVDEEIDYVHQSHAYEYTSQTVPT